MSARTDAAFTEVESESDAGSDVGAEGENMRYKDPSNSNDRIRTIGGGVSPTIIELSLLYKIFPRSLTYIRRKGHSTNMQDLQTGAKQNAMS